MNVIYYIMVQAGLFLEAIDKQNYWLGGSYIHQ